MDCVMKCSVSEIAPTCELYLGSLNSSSMADIFVLYSAIVSVYFLNIIGIPAGNLGSIARKRSASF